MIDSRIPHSFFTGLFVVCMLIGVVVTGQTAKATTLRIQPLQYQTELKKGERKKGHVDITNPANETVEAKLYVQAFRQVDNKGNLTFFKSEQLEKGLLLDYTSVTLEPRQTLRLFFIADGTKLPTGDVFGVIFAETASPGRPGTNTAVRVGSLIMITNQTPGARVAEITDLAIPFLQLGGVVQGSMTVKNPAPKDMATGFFPQITISVSPLGESTKRRGPLIFAGNERTIDFEQPSNALGFYQIKITANNTEKTAIVFLITGWWRALAPTLLVFIVGMIILCIKLRPKRRLVAMARR